MTRAIEDETEYGEVPRLIASARGAMNGSMAEVLVDHAGGVHTRRVGAHIHPELGAVAAERPEAQPAPFERAATHAAWGTAREGLAVERD